VFRAQMNVGRFFPAWERLLAAAPGDGLWFTSAASLPDVAVFEVLDFGRAVFGAMVADKLQPYPPPRAAGGRGDARRHPVAPYAPQDMLPWAEYAVAVQRVWHHTHTGTVAATIRGALPPAIGGAVACAQ